MDECQIIERTNEINEAPIKPNLIGIVYAICAEGDTYIGKTWTSLATRASGHKQSFAQYKKDSKLLCKSTHLMSKNKPCTMSIMSMHPIYDEEDKQKLLEEEKQFILNNDCVNKYEDEEVDEAENEEVEEAENEEEEETSIGTGTDCPCKIDIPIQIGCVYAIHDEFGRYIGSTIGPMSYRMNGHIRSAVIYTTSSISMRICSSHEIILRDNYTVEILEWVVVKSKHDLLTKEREWIEKTDCVNKNIPIRHCDESQKYHHDYYESHKNDAAFIETNQKYRDANKERIRHTHQRWNKENAEKMREYFRQRHQTLKSNPIYAEKRKEHKRNYNQSEHGKASITAYNHRLDVKEHRKKSYLIKKETATEEEKLRAKQVQAKRKSQMVECCGKKMTNGSLDAHKKTKKHIDNISTPPRIPMMQNK